MVSSCTSGNPASGSSRAGVSVSTSVPRAPRGTRLFAPGFARRAGLLLGAAALAAGCRSTSPPAVVRPEVRVPTVPPPRAGRGTVVGAVADSATGEPVWGAAVYFTRDSVIGTGRATRRGDLPADTTRRDGGFVLRDVPAGRYTLATWDLDHVPFRTVVIVREGEVDRVVLRPRRIGSR